MASSSPPVASTLPSSEIARQRTPPLCSKPDFLANVRYFLPLSTGQKRRPAPPLMSCVLSCENARLVNASLSSLIGGPSALVDSVSQILISSSPLRDANSVLSGENTSVPMGCLPTRSGLRAFHAGTSHSLINPLVAGLAASQPGPNDASVLPSGENSTCTQFGCLSEWTIWSVCASQTLSEPSLPPLARNLPSGEYARPQTS